MRTEVQKRTTPLDEVQCFHLYTIMARQCSYIYYLQLYVNFVPRQNDIKITNAYYQQVRRLEYITIFK
jgi:hypothetical protein